MTEPSATETTPKANAGEGGGDAAQPFTVEAARALFNDLFQANISPITKKLNGENASFRKQLQKAFGGETPPAADVVAPKGETPEQKVGASGNDFKLMREIGRIEQALPESVRKSIEEDIAADESMSLAQQHKLYAQAAKLNEMFSTATEEVSPQKPGPGARREPSVRGQPPAHRSTDALPRTKSDWSKLAIDKKREIFARDPAFDPDTLPAR